jgi:nitroreductase
MQGRRLAFRSLTKDLNGGYADDVFHQPPAAMENPPLASLRQLAAHRRSTRAFRAQAVPQEVIAELLQTAALAPSTFNTQPWRVHVLTGQALGRVSQVILARNAEGTQPPFSPFPAPCPPACRALQEDFGRRYYETLGIAQDDMAARARQTARNFMFFGAPAGLLLTISRELTPHSWLDLGLFLQTFMLAATERGLATCPQVAFVRFEDVIAHELGFSADERLACGVSLGWGDADAPVNRFALPRLGTDAFVRWHVDT